MSTAAQNQHHAAELANQAKAEAESLTVTIYSQFQCPCGSVFEQRKAPDGRILMACLGNLHCKNNGIFYEVPTFRLTRAKEPLP
jgi:hypothetical protein